MPQTRPLISILIVAITLQLINSQQQPSTPHLTSDFQVTTTDTQPNAQLSPHDFSDFKTTLQNNLKEQYDQMKQLQEQSKKSMQKLQEFDKQVKSWNQILEKINNFIHGFNNVLAQFNDKATTMMARVVGFQQELKAIVSIDTLIVCILSLVLVKILKDQFIDEGYQLVEAGLSQHQPITANEIPTMTEVDREIQG